MYVLTQGLRNGFLIPDENAPTQDTSTLSSDERAAAYAAELGVSPWLCTAFEATEHIINTTDARLASRLFSHPRDPDVSSYQDADGHEAYDATSLVKDSEVSSDQRSHAERLMTYRTHLLWAAREVANPADVPVLWDAILASRVMVVGSIPEDYRQRHAPFDVEQAQRDMVNHIAATTLRLKKSFFLEALGSDDIVAAALLPLHANAYAILELAWESFRQFNPSM